MNTRKLLFIYFASTSSLIGCAANGDTIQDAHKKARDELMAVWRGTPPLNKVVTVYGALVGTPKEQPLPAICDDPALLPQSIFPSKGRYTYLAMCNKKPVFVARIERADGETKVAVIFQSADDLCKRFPTSCSEGALNKPDFIRETQ